MSRAVPTPEPSPPADRRIPPLENGAHLSRPEFERRFDATPLLRKAELIEGTVYMPPPVTYSEHGRPHFDLISLLGVYRFATPGVEGADNSSIRLDLDNMPQPDVLLMLRPELGGQARVDDDGYIEGSPEFICEIAATSASIDLHRKLQLYRRCGVREYAVWRTIDGGFDYFVLRDGEYVRQEPRPTGEYRSEVLPGLWLDAAAILRQDWAAALRTLQQGVASPEHAAFVDRLRGRAGAGQPVP